MQTERQATDPPDVTQLKDMQVAIIGGGIGGLTAALALARRGARVTIYEQAPQLAEVGAGIQIGPNGVAVLEALGLVPAAAAVAAAPTAVSLCDGLSGRVVARIRLGEAARARYGRPYWQFHRADLLEVLAGALAGHTVTLRLGAEVAGLTLGAGSVELRLASGARERAALVVAADGVRSPCRTAHLSGAPAPFAGHVAWRGTVPAADIPGPAPTETLVFMGPGRHLVAYPLRAGRLVNVVAIERREAWAEEGWTHGDTPAAPRAAFRGWCGEVERLLGGLNDTFLWGLFDHPPLPRWSTGRLVLLGDACHPMLPFLAQGATMALEDAWVLAAELASAPDPETGLARYEARRKPRASRVQAAAAGNGTLYHLHAPLRQAAHFGLAAVTRLAPSLLLRRLDWIYGGNVVAEKDGAD